MTTETIDIKVPDIGDFDKVEVIEILVTEGQAVVAEDSLITLESDKATMDIPAPLDGVISQLLVKTGDMVSEGSAIAKLVMVDGVAQPETRKDDDPVAEPPLETEAAAEPEPKPESQPEPEPQSIDYTPSPSSPDQSPEQLPYASPAVRRFARELNAQLEHIQGSGKKGRILEQDVKDWVKQQLTSDQEAAPSTSGIPPIPVIDFSQFGEVEEVPLTRIQKISGHHLQRAWLNIPHVTHHDEADITELEAFRKSLKPAAEKKGVRVTILGFIIKILTQALKESPSFNASLHADGKSLVLKKYYNIGIAVDTPKGLMVPVIKDTDRKSIFALAEELDEVSQNARDGKLKATDLQGGCITISSLGGIGGSGFTPIVNAPEVAILGVVRARMTPVWNGKEFQPRLMLPLALSYDHRVIDGAEAARFMVFLVSVFSDLRRLLL